MSTVNFLDGAMFDAYKPHESDGISDWSPSLTRQEFAEECDINVIMKRYEVTGQLPANVREPLYLDLTTVPTDLMETLELMKLAETAFMTLPATVRREFDNNAVAFVDFASDPANVEQMRSWGLVPPAKAPAVASDAAIVPQAAPQVQPGDPSPVSPVGA